jgi:hypothetical protein
MKDLQWMEKIRFKHLPHTSNINKVAWNYYEKQIKRLLVVIKFINMLFTIQYIQKNMIYDVFDITVEPPFHENGENGSQALSTCIKRQ